MPVAEFYQDLMIALRELGIAVAINPMPCEIADCVPFDQDTVHAAYDADYAQRFLRVLSSAHEVFSRFRTGFLGKASPVHFFWGSFDLAVTRFSGRAGAAPPRRGAASAECGGAGGLFARGVERGLLAGRRRIAGRLRGVLFLCLSGAGGFCRGEGEARRRRSGRRSSANFCCPMTRCARRAIRTRR